MDMSVYFLLIVVIYSMSFVVSYGNPKNKWRFHDLFIILILVIFAGIRLDVGTDYKTYYSIFNNTESSPKKCVNSLYV